MNRIISSAKLIKKNNPQKENISFFKKGHLYYKYLPSFCINPRQLCGKLPPFFIKENPRAELLGVKQIKIIMKKLYFSAKLS